MWISGGSLEGRPVRPGKDDERKDVGRYIFVTIIIKTHFLTCSKLKN
jgi:hypothetical protein